MGKYLKMSEVFKTGTVTPRDSTMGGSLVLHANRAHYAAHAVNSHDELVQMNRELLAALELFRQEVPDNRHSDLAGVDPYQIDAEVFNAIDAALEKAKDL